MILSYKFELKPTREQTMMLNNTLNITRWLYNYMLEEKEKTYKTSKIGLTSAELQGMLPALKTIYPELKTVGSQILQEVIKRMYKAFEEYLSLKKGYPKYKGKNSHNSFVYPQLDEKRNFKKDNQIYIPKIGILKYNGYRAIDTSKAKTAILKKEGNKWYIIITIEHEDVAVEDKDTISLDRIVGIDLGVKKQATLSNGIVYENHRYLKKTEKKLKKAQQKLSKSKKGGRNRKKRKHILSKCHKKIQNQRKDNIHKMTKEIVKNYDIIIVEDLKVSKMLKNHNLAKHISDVSMFSIITILEYKTRINGKLLIKVDPRGTSQKCSNCKKEIKKDLSVRVHICDKCGLEIDRDLNASINILNLGKEQLKIA